MIRYYFRIRVDGTLVSSTFSHIPKPGLPFMGIGGLLADPLGVSPSVVLETVHGYPVPRAISGAVPIHCTPAVKEMAWYS